jgi:methylglutaconyl-CoA hydratase
MSASFRLIDVRREDCIDYVTLNRPDVRNAVNDAVIAELTQWAEAASADRELRMAVLSGVGKTFCAGADIDWMSRIVDHDQEAHLHDAWALARLFTRLDALPVPLVAGSTARRSVAGSGWWPSVTLPWPPRTRCSGSPR